MLAQLDPLYESKEQKYLKLFYKRIECLLAFKDFVYTYTTFEIKEMALL